jgi:2-C-methyl-D-erythritol 4-phosphate cytidylyltransferase
MSVSENKVWVLIPAAGIGSRMQSAIPKQYISIHGSTVLEHTIACFTDLSDIAGIVVVISEDDSCWQSIYKNSTLLRDTEIPIHYTYGGSTRASTVYNGLSFLLDDIGLSEDQWVMVHDAARPCVSQKDLLALFEATNNKKYDGAILAYKVKDTMKRAKAQSLVVDVTESREDLWHALTPQLFRAQELIDSLKKASLNGHVVTDESSAMEFSGKKIGLVEGGSENIKLTSPSDLGLIEFLLSRK